MPSHAVSRESSGPAEGGLPTESTESNSSKGCPQVPAAEVMPVAIDWSRAAGWESAASRKRVDSGLRRAKRRRAHWRSRRFRRR